MLKLIVITVIGFYAMRFLHKILIAIEKIEEEKNNERLVELRAGRKNSQNKFKSIAKELKIEHYKNSVEKFAEKSKRYNEKKGY